MTEFGDNMKSMMSGLNGDLSKREQLVKKVEVYEKTGK